MKLPWVKEEVDENTYMHQKNKARIPCASVKTTGDTSFIYGDTLKIAKLSVLQADLRGLTQSTQFGDNGFNL